MSLFLAIARWGGWRGKLAPAGSPTPISEAFSAFPADCILLFLLIYGYRIFFRNSPPKDGTLICTRCFEAAARNAPLQCECGGTRELLYNWRWQKDPEPTNTDTRNP